MDEKIIRVAHELYDLYCYRTDKFAFMMSNGDTVRNKPGSRIDEEKFCNHVNGGFTLSVIAGSRDTKFMCFDVDTTDLEVVRTIVSTIEEFGVPYENINVSTSGNKGYHIEIFFSSPVYNTEAKNFFDVIMMFSGLTDAKVEFMPTASRTIKVPLGINHKTGNRCWYLDTETLTPIEDIDAVFGINKIDHDLFCELVHAANKRRWYKYFNELKHRENEDITCERKWKMNKKSEPVMTEQGQRNKYMVDIATYERSRGSDYITIYSKLMDWCERQDQNLINSTEQEVRKSAEEIARWAVRNVEVKYIPPKRESKQNEPKVLKADDIKRILSAPTGKGRRIMLLMYMYFRMYGEFSMGYARIGKAIGCAEITVKTLIKKLVEKHLIKKERGGVVYEDGNPVYLPNKYSPGRTSDIVKIDTLRDSIEFTMPVSDGDIDDIYLNIMANMCDEETLAKFITKKELEEIKEIKNAWTSNTDGPGRESA